MSGLRRSARRERGLLGTYTVVLRRELLSLALLPQTYVIAAAYVVLSGVFFVSVVGESELPDLERFYSNIAPTLLVLAPIIAMRGFAEERSTGTFDTTMSWPLSRAGTVLAKFTAHVLFAWSLISVSWIYVSVLSRYGHVEMGKQVAGFIGLMVLAAAFSAVALAVSARSNSPAGGAFVGVLVLLCSWSVQYVEDWPLGDTLVDISPARRIESALQGVLYASDMGYFLVVVLLGLGVTYLSLEGHRGVARAVYLRRIVVVSVGLVAMISALGVIASDLTRQVDLTPTQRYTLTPASRQIARAVDRPIAISAFIDPRSAEAVQIRNLYRRYRAAGVDISLDVVDPDRQPGRMKALGVTGYGQLLVEIGDRNEMVDHFGEIAVTSAIYRVAREKARTVCFTTGHGERSIDNTSPDGYSGLVAVLRRVGYESRTVALAAPGAEEELLGCELVVIAGGAGRHEDGETAMLQSYLRRGGRMVLMAEGGQGDPSSLNRLLAGYGVRVEPGAVHDTASLADDSASVVTLQYPSASPVTARLSIEGLPTLVVAGQEIVPDEAAASAESAGDTVTPLLQTTPEGRRDGSGRKGPRALAVAIDRSAVTEGGSPEDPGPELERSRVGVVGSAEVGTNRYLVRFGNEEFLTSLVQWTLSEAEIIRAGRDPGGTRKIEISDDDQDDIVRRAIVLPTLAAVVPLPFAVRRMRRG